MPFTEQWDFNISFKLWYKSYVLLGAHKLWQIFPEIGSFLHQMVPSDNCENIACLMSIERTLMITNDFIFYYLNELNFCLCVKHNHYMWVYCGKCFSDTNEVRCDLLPYGYVTECKITAWYYIVVLKLQEPAFAMPIFICKGEAKAMKYSSEHEEWVI